MHILIFFSTKKKEIMQSTKYLYRFVDTVQSLADLNFTSTFQQQLCLICDIHR